MAILLHYFFLAAFSWMLCEGVMLFIWLNFVLYSGVFKTKKLFALIGWGEHSNIISINCCEYYAMILQVYLFQLLSSLLLYHISSMEMMTCKALTII